MNLSLHAAVAAVVVLCCTRPSLAAVRYVNASATGSGQGTSWTNAYTSLTQALAEAQPGDQLWVALGVYGPLTREGFFAGPGVSLYGGFVGNETSIAQRNPLSRSRLTHTSFRGACVLTLNNSSSSPHAVVDAFRMDFTLTHDHDGGGLALYGGTVTVRNCQLDDHIAGSGAAAYVSNSNATFDNCFFFHNWSQIGAGGGIEAVGTGSLTVTNSRFLDNISRELQGVPGSGGGIFNGPNSVLRVSNCSFDDCWAYNLGNQIVTIGGAIANESPNARVEHCFFIRNEASLGGAIGSTAPMTIVNCVITGNKASEPFAASPFETGQGGAIFAPEGIPLTIQNCTIVANWSKHTAAGLWCDASIDNSILWGNVSLVEPGDNPEPLVDQQFQGDITFRYSNVAGILGGAPSDPQHPGTIEANPRFLIAPLLTSAGAFVPGDLHLQPTSPCIDAGSNNLVPSILLSDLEGRPRFADRPERPDSGQGSSPLIDMGAYELPGPSCTADVDDGSSTGTPDGGVTIDDLIYYLTLFEAGDVHADVDDGTGTGTPDLGVTIDDLIYFLTRFEAGC